MISVFIRNRNERIIIIPKNELKHQPLLPSKTMKYNRYELEHNNTAEDNIAHVIKLL